MGMSDARPARLGGGGKMADDEAEQELPRAGARTGPTPICAIGASAGGVGALRSLFKQLPEDLGLAYVVIVHLAPDHPSAMSEILAACTKMPVLQVDDTPVLKADHVHVIAPDRELVIEGDNVHARPFGEPRGRRAPIDVFFRSVAAARGDGMAVVLSGTGADGAVGVRAVKEAGGVVFVQEPTDAEFRAMPQNAIATGVADVIAPLDRLAERIAEVARSKEAVRSLDLDGSANELRRVISFLRMRTGHDFSNYKRATVMRRVMRRMQLRRMDQVSDYARYLSETPEEAHELFADLLITVTMFFRDADAFETLAERAIEPILDDVDEEGVRAWVAGCATGEEAYSLAILMLEAAERRGLRVPIQVFATDLDEGSLATAREGRYPRAIEADVSEERLVRFFTDEGTHYRVRRELRDVVLFASHSVLKEPPFLRLDLVSCRNVMIYLERALQRQLCSVFHYGLKPDRFLFLGSAETADVAPELFVPVEREARLYRASAQAQRTLPILPQTISERSSPEAPSRPPAREDAAPAHSHAAALERSAPPSVLVDAAHALVHLSPTAGRFILHSAGPFTRSLPAVVRPELRVDLKASLDRVFEQKQPVLAPPVAVSLDGTDKRVTLHVSPVFGGQREVVQAIVLFLESDPAELSEEDDAGPTQGEEVRRLRWELRAAQERLAASRGEQEAATQDLRAANEELQSINEEYRSASEELETSKEELQSMNEELQTVNAELKGKLDSISSAHSDLQNLTTATEIGTLFLDPKLRIRMFTPPVAALFNITPTDIGRAITDFTHRLAYDGVEEDARRVLRDLAPVESEVESRDGRGFMMRLRPYRTIEERIDGVVVTFVDITSRREIERRLSESEKRYKTLFDSIDEGFCVIEMIFDGAERPVDYRFLDVNAAFERQTGLGHATGRTVRELVPEQEAHWFETYGRIAMSREAERFEAPAEALGRHYEVYAFPVGAPAERTVGVLFNDITTRKRAEEERELLTHELSHRVKNTLAVVQALAMQTDAQAGSVVEYRRRLIGRIQALGRAHGLLLETSWRSTDLHRLVEQSLAPHAMDGRPAVEIGGDRVSLNPKQGLGLSLVLHELATNAAKHGSLSSPEGRLDVTWRIEEEGDAQSVHLTWREQDGPTVEPPRAMGFGVKLIERACSYELGGEVELRYDPAGFVCSIEWPLT